jgi:hypothetical protein
MKNRATKRAAVNMTLSWSDHCIGNRSSERNERVACIDISIVSDTGMTTKINSNKRLLIEFRDRGGLIR